MTARRRRSRGEGHVGPYQTGKGTRFFWKATLDRPDGTRKPTWKRGYLTKKAAQAGLRAALAASDGGTYTEPPSKRTTGSWMTEWPTGLRLSPATVTSYQRCVRLHVVPYIGGVPLAALTPARLNTLYAHLEAGGRADHKAGSPLSPRTVRYVHTIISAALRAAVRQGLLARNPAADASPPTAKQAASPEIHPWTAEQLSAFLSWASGHSRYFAAWRLMAFTGMRRGEALALRWRDIDLDAGTVSVRRSVGVTHALGEPAKVAEGLTKTARPRVVSLDTATADLLRTWRWEREVLAPELAADSALVFSTLNGSHEHPERFSRAFRDAQQRCRNALGGGAPPLARLHDLRHTHATLLQMSNVTFSASFGHLREHALPAGQRTALRRSQHDEASHSASDLGCQQPVATGARMRYLIRLQEVTVCCGRGNVQKRSEGRSSIRRSQADPFSMVGTLLSTSLAAGVPVKVVSERLGHASIVITLTTYAHTLPGDQQRAADQFAALMGKQP